MKKIILRFIVIICIMGGHKNINAQQFSTGELATIKPLQVIVENYTQVNLSEDIIKDQQANRFDINNPYTYLQIILDAKTSRYHILFQTSFTGKILFLSYSNNLSVIFNKKNKPMFLFTHCLKKINNHLSSIQIIDAVITCMLERLNYCYDN